jgi:hypothetical protein
MPGFRGRLLEWITGGAIRRMGRRTWRTTLKKQRGRLIDRHSAALAEATRARHAAATAKTDNARRDAELRLHAAECEAESLTRDIARKDKAIERAAVLLLAASLSGCATGHDITRASAKALIVAGETGLSACEAREPAPRGCGTPECQRARLACLRLPYGIDETQDIADAIRDLYDAIGLYVQTGAASGVTD